jgi:hypothetical protein
MLSSLPNSAFINIQSFLDESDISNLALASVSISKYGNKKEVSFNSRQREMSHVEFIQYCSRNKNTLRRMTLSNLRNPLVWVPFWCTEMKFVDCGRVHDRITHAVRNGAGVYRKVKITEENNGVITYCSFMNVPRLAVLI